MACGCGNANRKAARAASESARATRATAKAASSSGPARYIATNGEEEHGPFASLAEARDVARGMMGRVQVLRAD